MTARTDRSVCVGLPLTHRGQLQLWAQVTCLIWGFPARPNRSMIAQQPWKLSGGRR